MVYQQNQIATIMLLISMKKDVLQPICYVSYKYRASTTRCPMMRGQPVVTHLSKEPCFQMPNVTWELVYIYWKYNLRLRRRHLLQQDVIMETEL